MEVVKAAKDAITDGGADGTTPAEAFDAALRAARDTGGTREAVASETGTPVEETAAYRSAFEAAKAAGADEETAREVALEAVAEAAKESPGSGGGHQQRGSSGEESHR